MNICIISCYCYVFPRHVLFQVLNLERINLRRWHRAIAKLHASLHSTSTTLNVIGIQRCTQYFDKHDVR
ncbi:hypothetical protein M407DRAFT_92544 [Tulasnella calospora MUT 4182]|uniref:Uncharacterized protein n=1 Tax=Tulasnella calospora MUT 4182 TaxID=1051891 RepID=A0A0C3KUX4_9AGAM|nr:hypothetical protein M407DRAFT_92544 [Tulasnella calospora MUT 4182]